MLFSDGLNVCKGNLVVCYEVKACFRRSVSEK
jgi:hypothetical protein